MRRRLPGLHSWQPDDTDLLRGLFLVCIERAFFRWQPKKPYLELRFTILEPEALEQKSFVARLDCTPKSLSKLCRFLKDFGYDAELLSRDEVDVKALLGLQGVVRTSPCTRAGRPYQTIDAFAPAVEWAARRTESVLAGESEESTRVV